MKEENEYNFDTKELSRTVGVPEDEVIRLLNLTKVRENTVEAGFHRSAIKMSRGNEILKLFKKDFKDYDYGRGLALLELGQRYFTSDRGCWCY